MITPEELLIELELNYPLCSFSINRKRIVLSQGILPNGKNAFSFDQSNGYELGINNELFNFLKERNYIPQLINSGVVYITPGE